MSHCHHHYISQYIVRVGTVVSVQAMKAYEEVEIQLQSFLNLARDGASGQVHALTVNSQRNILSPLNTPLPPARRPIYSE
jgi:hypothetical protein